MEYAIGELAARCGVATHVLRHWEDAGLSQTLLEHGLRCRHDGPRACAHFQSMVLARLDGVPLAEALDHP
jgi:hypothetical protein